MAYSVSSSVEQGTITFVDIHGPHAGSSYMGGYFNPSGDKLFIPTQKANNESKKGIDIYQSGASGYTFLGPSLVPTLNGSTSARIDSMVFVSDSEFLATTNTTGTDALFRFVTASDGWTVTDVGDLDDLSYGSQYSLKLNPSKNKLLITAAGQDDINISIYDASGDSWSDPDDLINISNADVQGSQWISDTEIVIGEDYGGGSNRGRIWYYRQEDGTDGTNSSHWDFQESVQGNTNEYVGAGMYYHTGSNTLLTIKSPDGQNPYVQSSGISQLPTPTTIDLFKFVSGSGGAALLPDATGDFVSVEENIFPWNLRAIEPDPNDGNRFYVLEKSGHGFENNAFPVQLTAWEYHTSADWKRTVITGTLNNANNELFQRTYYSYYSHQSVKYDGSAMAVAGADYNQGANNGGMTRVFSFNFPAGGGGGGGGGGSGEEIMARTFIGKKLIGTGQIGMDQLATGSVQTKQLGVSSITRDKIASGSVEIEHLNFAGNIGTGDYLVDLQDADILAVGDNSDSSNMHALKLGDLKNYVNSGSAVGGTSGSLQFNSAGGLGGILQFQTDGAHITASNNAKIYFQARNAPTGSRFMGFIQGFKRFAEKEESSIRISGSFLQLDAGSGSFEFQKLGTTQVTFADGSITAIATVSGSAATFHDLSADDVTLGGTTVNSLTASNGVMIGTANSDDLNIQAGLISNLVPQNDEKVNLGSATKQFAVVYGVSASFGDNVGVGGTLTAIEGVSGSAATFHDLTADDVTLGGTTVNSLTASNGVMIGTANSDDLNIQAGLVSNLVPQNDEKVNLGSATKQFAVIYGVSASFGDNVGVGGTLTAIEGVTSAGTISGSAITTETVTADKGVISQITAVSFTGSGGMMIGNAASDDLNIQAGLISNFVPQNDSQVSLGSSTKQFAAAHIDTGNIDTVVATAITASFAKITSLDVDTIVSRTVTKDSLEIKDNLIIAGVSGSKAGDHVGAGFQIGGTVGVQGTGSSPLMSLTLGSRTVTGDALIVNVDGQAGASFESGSATIAALGTAGMRFGVTGSISGSLIQAKRLEAGHLALRGALTSTSLSGSTVRAHDLLADDATLGGITANSITASNGVMIGTANSDDLNIQAGLISNLVPQNDEKVNLGSATKQFAVIYGVSASFGDNVGVGGTLTAVEAVTSATITGTTTVSGAAGTFFQVTTDKLHGTGIVTQDNVQTGSIVTAAIVDSAITTGKLAATSVTKAKLAKDIIQNNADAHGGLVYASGRLSVGFVRQAHVRADGSNISGSAPTKGMFASHAVPTPYTTASLSSQPASGSLMVYLNGVLLHPDHPGSNAHGPTSADYRINTGSANAHKVLLAEALALDSDDILTITFLSGSGVS
jgi:hypothetical protein